MRYSFLFPVTVAIGLFSASMQAKASSITYLFNGTISGFLIDNNQVVTPLINDPFTLTLTGDTNGLSTDPVESIQLSSSAVAQVTLNGFGSGTTVDQINVVAGIGFPFVGFADFTLPDQPGVALFAPGLGTSYGLNTGIGPVAAFYVASSPAPLPTSFGGITFEDFNGTFTAVPEPSACAFLIGLSVAGAGFLRRRRGK